MTAPDWALIRRTYRGGKGGTLADMAERFGVPVGSLFYHSAQERWRQDANLPPSHARVRARARQLVKESPEVPSSQIRRQLEREFGKEHPAIPSNRTLAWWRPNTKPPAKVPDEEVTLDGLTRNCPACSQRTTRDPCAHCGTASREAA